MKKNSAIAAIIGLLLATSAIPTFAQNYTGSKTHTITTKSSATGSGEKIREQNTESRLIPTKKQTLATTGTDNLKQRASNEITRRITSLTNVISKITAIKRLTDSQKAPLINGIQAEIESLKVLNTKIQADTDLTTLRTDIKSIVNSYRIYLLYLPQTQIIIAADKLLNTADTLTELAAKLQSRIDETKGKGEDVSSLETTLTDMQTKIADAKTQANNAINAVSALQPTGYPGNKTSLQSARSMLQAALKDLQSIRQDTQKIIVVLRKLGKNVVASPAITASPSAASITNIPTE